MFIYYRGLRFEKGGLDWEVYLPVSLYLSEMLEGDIIGGEDI